MRRRPGQAETICAHDAQQKASGDQGYIFQLFNFLQEFFLVYNFAEHRKI